jgi:hypothetical protein
LGVNSGPKEYDISSRIHVIKYLWGGFINKNKTFNLTEDMAPILKNFEKKKVLKILIKAIKMIMLIYL